MLLPTEAIIENNVQLSRAIHYFQPVAVFPALLGVRVEQTHSSLLLEDHLSQAEKRAYQEQHDCDYRQSDEHDVGHCHPLYARRGLDYHHEHQQPQHHQHAEDQPEAETLPFGGKLPQFLSGPALACGLNRESYVFLAPLAGILSLGLSTDNLPSRILLHLIGETVRVNRLHAAAGREERGARILGGFVLFAKSAFKVR